MKKKISIQRFFIFVVSCAVAFVMTGCPQAPPPPDGPRKPVCETKKSKDGKEYLSCKYNK